MIHDKESNTAMLCPIDACAANSRSHWIVVLCSATDIKEIFTLASTIINKVDRHAAEIEEHLLHETDTSPTTSKGRKKSSKKPQTFRFLRCPLNMN